MALQLSLPLYESSGYTTHFARGSREERGAIFTRREIVDFILDLVGYTANHPLHQYRILEPSCGQGDFLVPIVERLLTSYANHVPSPRDPIADITAAVRAVEVHHESINHTRRELSDLLQRHGINNDTTTQLLDNWIMEGDFLLVGLKQTFTHIVGNPPYVR